MKNLLLLLAFLCIVQTKGISQLGNSQILTPYSHPDGASAHNDDFNVRVKKNNTSSWVDLFEYETFVNKAGGFDGDGDGIREGNFEISSFVNFDYNGTINVEITCNYCADEDIAIKNVMVRPLSKNITTLVNDQTKTIFFSLNFNDHGSSNLSVEINGDRYRNIHVFANEPFVNPYSEGQYITVEDMMMNLSESANNNARGSEYRPESGDRILIEGNEVFKYPIVINNNADIEIIGRGVIDLRAFGVPDDNDNPRKVYDANNIPENYEFRSGVTIRNCQDFESCDDNIINGNITVDGIIINDAQHRPINISRTKNVDINNVKIFSRVLWGGGIYMEASSNINIDTSFIRTSDDCIPIYPVRIIRVDSMGVQIERLIRGNAKDITVRNSSLYADKAHPIIIGWHGTDDPFNRARAENIRFENIDILDHDETDSYYHGAMAVHCGDRNYCQNITFKDIRVEGFTNGSLFNIIVEPGPDRETRSDGYRVQNILFENISYNANQSLNETTSHITGIDDCFYVNGVRLNDLNINNVLITEQNYTTSNIQIDDFAYDVTFGNVSSSSITSGTYYIINRLDQSYLNPTIESLDQVSSYHHTVTAPWTSKWIIEETEDDGYYTIKSTYNGNYLSATTFENHVTGTCHGDFVVTSPFEQNQDRLKWKFIDVGNGYYRIADALNTASLVKSSILSESNSGNEYTGAYPWRGLYRQRWRLQNVNTRNTTDSQKKDFKLSYYPNIADDILNINLIQNPSKQYSITIYDVLFRPVVQIKNATEKNVIDLSNISDGQYFIHIFDGIETFKKQLLIRHK